MCEKAYVPNEHTRTISMATFRRLVRGPVVTHPGGINYLRPGFEAWLARAAARDLAYVEGLRRRIRPEHLEDVVGCEPEEA